MFFSLKFVTEVHQMLPPLKLNLTFEKTHFECIQSTHGHVNFFTLKTVTFRLSKNNLYLQQRLESKQCLFYCQTDTFLPL